jgi:Protein of unknown function (DUF2934)
MHRDHEYIQILAYRIWEGRGRPDGSAEQDWLEAERQASAGDAAAATSAAARAAPASPPETQLSTPNMKMRAPATPQPRPTLRTSAPITDRNHASKKQEPGWPGSS